MKSHKSVDVVIPSWNGRDYLDVCLASLKQQNYRDFDIIVVDNASTDGSDLMVKEKHPEVRLIQLRTNTGFSGAVNEGIRASQAKYIALLNQDTEVDPGWLEQLTQTLDQQPEIDFCATKLMQFDNRDIIDSAGDGFLRGGISIKCGSGQEDNDAYRKPREVFGACAAAAIYRRQLFETVGLFDDNLVDYSTDGDFNFRGQLMGKRCYFVPTAIVYHHVAASTTTGSAGFIRRINRNAVITVIKNYPTPLLIQNALKIALVFLSTLWIYPHPLAAIRGRADALKMIPRLRKTRRTIQKNRIVSLKRLNNMMNPRL